MLEILGIAVLIVGFAIIVWVAGRLRRSSAGPGVRSSAAVSGDDARAALYPYVFVSDRGSVRELHASERDLLETPFRPLDAGRPFIKRTFDQKNGRGSLSGYCRRSDIPRRVAIGYPPIEKPAHQS